MLTTVVSRLAALAGMAALVWTVVEERRAGRVPFASLGARWFGRAGTSAGTIAVAIAAGVLLVVLPLLPAIAAGQLTPADAASATTLGVFLTVAAKLALVAFEEITFRGALLDQLRARLGTRQAVVACALLFGLAHAARPGDPDHAAVVAVTFVDGLGYAAAAALTGSLWTPIAWHAAKNLAVWQVTGVSSLQFAPGTFASGAAGAPATMEDAAWAAAVVALAVPLVWATTRRPRS
jgi:membrane protease YdiL (CAAX protease family)